MNQMIFLFGEAEKGDLRRPIPCRSLDELAEIFGNPPEESQGLSYAVQALLYKRRLIYFRVEEEGFSMPDYHCGMQMLRRREVPERPRVICMPGMGNAPIIHEMSEICFLSRSILIITEKDFYDYLTN
jgi:hypothetical protein